MKKLLLLLIIGIIATPAIIANNKIGSYFSELENKDVNGFTIRNLETDNKYYEATYTYNIGVSETKKLGLPVKTVAKFLPHKTTVKTYLNFSDKVCPSCNKNYYEVIIDHLEPNNYNGNFEISGIRQENENLKLVIQRLNSNFSYHAEGASSELNSKNSLSSLTLNSPDIGIGRSFSLGVKDLTLNYNQKDNLKLYSDNLVMTLGEITLFDLLEVRGYEQESHSEIKGESHYSSEYAKAEDVYIDKSLDMIAPRIYGYEYDVKIKSNGSLSESLSQYIEHNKANFSGSMNSLVANVIDKKHDFAKSQNASLDVKISIDGAEKEMLSLIYHEKGLSEVKDNGDYVVGDETELFLDITLTNEFIREFSKFSYIGDIVNMLIEDGALAKNKSNVYTLNLKIDKHGSTLNDRAITPNYKVLSDEIRKLDKKVI